MVSLFAWKKAVFLVNQFTWFLLFVKLMGKKSGFHILHMEIICGQPKHKNTIVKGCVYMILVLMISLGLFHKNSVKTCLYGDNIQKSYKRVEFTEGKDNSFKVSV